MEKENRISIKIMPKITYKKWTKLEFLAGLLDREFCQMGKQPTTIVCQYLRTSTNFGGINNQYTS